jgi:hypothetical protein
MRNPLNIGRLALAVLGALAVAACAGPTSSSFLPSGAGTAQSVGARAGIESRSTPSPTPIPRQKQPSGVGGFGGPAID